MSNDDYWLNTYFTFPFDDQMKKQKHDMIIDE